MERISEGVYTLSKLSPNVKLKDVRKIGTMTRRIKPALPMAEEEGNKCLQKDWWADLVMDNISVSVGTALQMRRVPGGGSVVLSMLRGKNVEPQPETSSKKTEPLLLSPPQEFREPTPAEILEQTRAQYYETLYLAKTAIAYFAKSILSRARVMFQDGESESAQSPNRLIEFLQDMCIPLDKMDIKYRKTILQSATEDTVDDKAVYKDKEEEYVHRWVAKTFNDRMLQCNDQKLKRQTEDLKIRE